VTAGSMQRSEMRRDQRSRCMENTKLKERKEREERLCLDLLCRLSRPLYDALAQMSCDSIM
jgi:hypothetical protein